MAIVFAGGEPLEIEQTGSGPDLVLLHSLLTDPRSFSAIVPALSRSRRVTLLGLPGFGRSAPAGASIEDSADRVASFLGSLGGKPDVLGNGYGGFVALALAARHGEKIGKLVMVDTGAAFPEAGRAPFRAMAEAVGKGGMAAVVDAAVRRIFPDDWLAAHPQAAAERREVLLRMNVASFAAACRALAKVDLRPELPRIQNPALVVVGSFDAATPPPLARELASGIPGAQLVELPGCGHCPPLQQPAELVAAIAPFLGIQA
ncbi:MAG TPA: alpha/beta fold hydrolase [Myxococcales bacterium]|nr:alpha/beta fold hydrolase [Myxococcales bacterium]